MPFISNLYLYLIAFQKSSTPVILKVFKGYLLLCSRKKLATNPFQKIRVTSRLVCDTVL